MKFQLTINIYPVQNILSSVTEQKQKLAVALVYVALCNPVRRVELMMDLTLNVNTPDGTLLMQTLAGCSCKHRCAYAQALGIPAMAKKVMQTLLMPVDCNWNALRLSTRHAFTPTVDTDRCDALLCFASHVPILSPGPGHFLKKNAMTPLHSTDAVESGVTSSRHVSVPILILCHRPRKGCCDERHVQNVPRGHG